MAKANGIVQITKCINKKGKLKGKNKKETKIIKASCPHHKVTKKGNIKATVSVIDDYCTCYLCGERFPASFFKDDEINRIVDEMIELNSQNKFTAAATNAGNDALDYFAKAGVLLTGYKKKSKKIRNLAQKTNKVKNKSKNNYSGSSTYGSWGSSKRR